MRVPVQAPAVVRNQRSRPVRRFARGRAAADGVRPSQYDGDDEGDVGEEEGADDGDEAGEEGNATVESE